MKSVPEGGFRSVVRAGRLDWVGDIVRMVSKGGRDQFAPWGGDSRIDGLVWG